MSASTTLNPVLDKPSSGTKPSKESGMHRVTLKDVAAKSNVALSTASDILNNRSRCYASKKTADRVRQIARELGYVANANAALLGGGNSDLIGVVTSPLTSPYHALLVHHLSEKLEAQGYRILLSIAGGNEARQRRSVMDLLDQRAAGVIVCTEHPSLLKHVESTLEKKIPMAMIGPSGNGSTIGCDLSECGFIAGKHLVDIGCKKIVCLKDNSEAHLDKSRSSGLSLAVNNKVDWLKFISVEATDVAHKTSIEVVEKLMHDYPDVDGIFAYSDAIALPLMRHLLNRGKRIPEDIAVVGFDDLPQAFYSSVPLTTIAQPIEEYANRAIEVLFNNIENINKTGRADIGGTGEFEGSVFSSETSANPADFGGTGVSPVVSAQQKTNHLVNQASRVPVAEYRAVQHIPNSSGASPTHPQLPIDINNTTAQNEFKCQLIVRQSTNPNWTPQALQTFKQSLSHPKKSYENGDNSKTLKERKHLCNAM